jgi:uncharacterized protein YhaN
MSAFWGGFAGTLKDNIQQVGDEYRKLKALEDAEVRQDAREEKRYTRNRLDAKADRTEELNDDRYLDPKYMTMEDGVLMAESMTTDAGGYRVMTKAPANAQQKAAWEAYQKEVTQKDEERDLSIQAKKVNIQADKHRMSLDERQFGEQARHNRAMEDNDRQGGGASTGTEVPGYTRELLKKATLYPQDLELDTTNFIKDKSALFTKYPSLSKLTSQYSSEDKAKYIQTLARKADAGDPGAAVLFKHLLPYLLVKEKKSSGDNF